MSTADSLLIKKIIGQAAEKGATDIHLTAGNYPFLRINGALLNMNDVEIIKPETLEEMVTFFLTEEQQKKFLTDKEITVIYNESTGNRLRINIFYQKGYPMISMRFISSQIPDLVSLGLPQVVQAFVENKRGLIVISGTYGSGKSTTMASLLQHVNLTRAEHMITLEDPIEYLFVNEKSIIEQREIGKDVPTLEDGLNTILNEDINIVAVMARLSSKTIENILELAESGRLVILSLDSDSANSVLDKIIASLTPEKKAWGLNVLADVLLGILVQRLIPKARGGRALAYEVLVINAAIRSLIKESKFYQINSIMQTSRSEGMINFDKCLLDLFKKGEITKEQAIRESLDKESFTNLVSNY